MNPDDTMPKAWRCTGCGEVIFNLKWSEGRMVKQNGAPVPHYYSVRFPRLCTLCFELQHFSDCCPYFRKLSRGEYNTGFNFRGL